MTETQFSPYMTTAKTRKYIGCFNSIGYRARTCVEHCNRKKTVDNLSTDDAIFAVWRHQATEIERRDAAGYHCAVNKPTLFLQ